MISKFRLKDFKFKKIVFEMNEDFLHSSQKHVQIEYDFSLSIHMKSPEECKKALNPDDMVIDSKVELGVGVFKKLSKNSLPLENVPFSIELLIVGLFEMADPVPQSELEQFSRLNAVAMLMPYARAMVSSITAGANFPPLVLPLFNIQEIFGQQGNAQHD